MIEPNNSDAPSAPVADMEPLASSPHRKTYLARSIGILVLDDDAAIRRMLDSGLRHFGFTVWIASNAAEAVSIYAHNRSSVDLVLLDVRMAGRDGPETLAELQTVDCRPERPRLLHDRRFRTLQRMRASRSRRTRGHPKRWRVAAQS